MAIRDRFQEEARLVLEEAGPLGLTEIIHRVKQRNPHIRMFNNMTVNRAGNFIRTADGIERGNIERKVQLWKLTQ